MFDVSPSHALKLSVKQVAAKFANLYLKEHLFISRLSFFYIATFKCNM